MPQFVKPVFLNSGGDNVIQTVDSSHYITVQQIVLQANALTTMTFKAGSGSLSGPMSFTAAAEFVWEHKMEMVEIFLH